MSSVRDVVVALVPAKDRADSVADTVRALLRLPAIDRVLVIDDGSTDATAAKALDAGATVLRLPRNRGKGGAVRAGAESAPDADVFLLIDADLAGTASGADALLRPVLDGDADLAIGVLPAAGTRGGFGKVRQLARTGIKRTSGFDASAPLSGQRAVRAGLLRDLGSAERFGLEVAMTIDAIRAGARVVEIEVAMDHRHTGRTVAGFRHRSRQGVDIVRSLWPRLTSATARTGILLVATAVALVAMLASSSANIPTSVAPTAKPQKVVVVGVPRLDLEDLDRGRVPELDKLWKHGAIAAMSVRTLSGGPSSVEAYATIGAGTRINAELTSAIAYRRDYPLEGGTAAQVLERRTGVATTGEVVVPSAPMAARQAGSNISSFPGALGDALHASGRRVGVVGSADYVDLFGERVLLRPAPIAVMSSTGSVDVGLVDSSKLLMDDPTAPFGLRADIAKNIAAVHSALENADVVVVDQGDTERAGQYGPLSSSVQAEQARERALRWTDQLVGRLAKSIDSNTLLLVVGLTPPSATWELTPLIAHGAGVVPGYLHSTSTKRLGLVTLTDVTTTILDSVGVKPLDGMIGAPLRYHPGKVSVSNLEGQNKMAGGREGIYFPIALTFIIVQALTYLFTILALGQGAHRTRVAPALRYIVLVFASWPLATFALRAFPQVYELGGAAQAVLWAVAAAVALAASRARRHPMSPLAWICGATALILVVDVATGARLQISSILGYSPHTAARFTGYGNTAFAVLAASATLFAAIHVHHAPRRREALIAVACFLTIVVFADGAPTLGNDVGGILTLVPVFGLMLYSMSGRRLSVRSVLTAGVAGVVVVCVAAGVDLLRPAGSRTHLGDFVAGIFNGDGTAGTTIGRKWAVNIHVFQTSIWTWMVPITAVYLIYVLVISKGWRRLLPPGSALRAGIIACVVAGVLGWLVNDSGVVVTALAFVYAGPYLTLLALDGELGDAEMLAPTARAGDPPAGPAGVDILSAGAPG